MKESLDSSPRVRNRIGWRQYVSRLQGAAVQFDLRAYDAPLAAINELEHPYRELPDGEIARRAGELRDLARSGTPLAELRAEMFALAREASQRVLGVRPFDEQIVAALALDGGAIVEMQTGEGKTLTAVMPSALNALAGRGVHVLTFNDYLARRDAEWMGPIYHMLGLSAGYVQQEMAPDTRRAAYLADITYVTAKEAGFDHLRDLLATEVSELVHRPFHFALVDEADSLMIDEARVPLVIAGSVGRDDSRAVRLAGIVASLSSAVHFDTDAYARNVELTDAGIEHLERVLACGNLHGEANYRLLTELNCALHARVLLRRDVDYIVRNGRIEIVDEFTGRVVDDRHWPDGLQAALEAKEGLEARDDGRILGSMTLQHFLRGYPRLCGMTGTVQDAASELRQLYGVETVVIPTHRPMVRVDQPDVVFTHRDAKERALVDEIRRANASARPVLVGTLTIEESEHLFQRLRATGVVCQVLNAKNDAVEARIVAGAGAPGAVTIATNMAGRGTDIRLGGADETDRDRVVALGGLYVVGTNRHESRRVDLQLRGRAGRQGDPGESRFFLSLDDDLLVRYNLQNLISARFVPTRSDAAIDNPIVRREIARVQRIIEGQNAEIRQTLSRYASVVEEQYRSITERRRELVLGLVTPDVWHRLPERRAALVAAAGEAAVCRAERLITLFHVDRLWSDHLALCADLREGIHLVRLGGQVPLERFTTETKREFSQIEEAVDACVLAALEDVRVNGTELDLTAAGLTRPSATWTYLVNDDPFRSQIGLTLMGPGGKTVAIYSAALLMPLLVLWGLIERFRRKRPRRRTDPLRRP